MLEGKFESKKEQITFDTKARIEVNPNQSGFLVSNYESHKDLGKLIKKGDQLGYILDMYSLNKIEDLTSPVDGYLFFSRYSGVVDVGTKAFAIADSNLIKKLKVD